jgi:hypothetical protein
MSGRRCEKCDRSNDENSVHRVDAAELWLCQVCAPRFLPRDEGSLSEPGAEDGGPDGPPPHFKEENEEDNTPTTRTRTRTRTRSTSSPYVPPGPGGNPRPDDGPELPRLIEAHKRGQLEPEEVTLGEIPVHAGAVARAIAEHMRLLIGLRYAANERRPLPYATSFAVACGVAQDKGTASKAIGALVRAGVVEHVGSMPPMRPGLDGTKLYAPPANVAVLADRRAA